MDPSPLPTFMLKQCKKSKAEIMWMYYFDIVYGRWSASIFGLKFLLIVGYCIWQMKLRLFLVKNQCWSQCLLSKACWRKEIKFLLSEKIFFSCNCVILIMLISSDFFFSFDDLFDNGNSIKNWYAWSVWSKCSLLYCLLLFLLCGRGYFIVWNFPFAKIFLLWFYISASDLVTGSHSMLKWSYIVTLSRLVHVMI